MVLYHDRLFELAAEIPPFAEKDLHAKSKQVSRLCGSEVSLALQIQDQIILDFDMSVKACVLGQASAGVFAKYAKGAHYDEILSARNALKAMLKDDGPPPEGRFWELRYLQSVADFPPRQPSVMLAFDAAVDAYEYQIKKGDEHEVEYSRS